MENQHAEQKQQIAELTAQQLELIRNQNERWESIEKRQFRADGIVEALQSDVTSLKTVMQDRLRAAEETQSKLTEELHTTRAAVTDDILWELEAKFTTKEQLEATVCGAKSSLLRASAPTFIPSTIPPSTDVVSGPVMGASCNCNTHSLMIGTRHGTPTNCNLRC